MQLSDFSNKAGEWLSSSGPDSDLVISSRIRLARNLQGFPFLSRASSAERAQITSEIHGALNDLAEPLELTFLDLKPLHSIDRQVLMERHLISREHAFSKGERSAAFSGDEDTSIMVNEEDHLRLQVLRSGFQLAKTWEAMNSLDDRLEQHLQYAFDPQYGYLTICPTNVGTGLRASVMLHLPGLVMTRQIEKVFQGKLDYKQVRAVCIK